MRTNKKLHCKECFNAFANVLETCIIEIPRNYLQISPRNCQKVRKWGQNSTNILFSLLLRHFSLHFWLLFFFPCWVNPVNNASCPSCQEKDTANRHLPTTAEGKKYLTPSLCIFLGGRKNEKKNPRYLNDKITKNWVTDLFTLTKCSLGSLVFA